MENVGASSYVMPECVAAVRKKTQWVMLLLVLLAVGCAVGANIYVEYRQAGAREEERLATQNRAIRENLVKTLESTNTVLELLQKDIARGIRPEQDLAGRLKLLVDAMPGVRALFVLNEQGIGVAASRPDVIVGKNFSYRDYFQTPLKHPDRQTLYLSQPFKTVTGVYSMNVTRMIADSDGTFAGVVTATLDPEYFATLLSSVLYAKDMWAGIVHHDGTLFMMIPETPGGIGKNLYKPGTFFARHRDSGLASSIHTGNIYATGQNGMLAISTVNNSRLKLDKPLIVTTGRNLAAVYEPWQRGATVQAALFTLVAVTALSGLALYRKRRREHERYAVSSAMALKESTERLALATVAAGVGVWDYTPATGELVWDDTMYAMYGVVRSDAVMLFDCWRRAILPDDRAGVETSLREALRDGHEFNIDFRICRNGGEIRTIRAIARLHNGTGSAPLRMIGINEDITERTRSEEALRESRQQLANIIDFLPDATFVVDNDMKVIAWNRAMEEMSGISKEEMLGQGDHAYTIPFYGERRKQLLDLLDTSDAELEAKYQNVQRRGETLNAEVFAPATYGGKGAYIWVSGAPLYSVDNKRVGAIEILRDVSDRKKVEQDLQQARQAAETANLAKSEFLANMSHEIRTPMNAITGMAYLTLQTVLDVRQREYVGIIRGAADSLLGIINDILDFSKIEAGKMELETVAFGLNELFGSVRNLIAVKAEDKDLEILFSRTPGTPEMLTGDPLRLGQVLNNLVSNAIKFTERGKIVVAVSACFDESRPGCALLTFKVTDTGIGMDDEHLERIFTPFTQADSSITRRFGGTGLGLSIVIRLLELMGSTLEVVSKPGCGSTFSFTVALGLPAEQVGDTVFVPEGLKDLRVLVVDDSPDVCMMLGSIMEELSFSAVTVTSGAAALDELARAASTDGEAAYRLVLIDWRMPDMDGLETTRRIRDSLALFPLPEIILMSGYSATDVQEEAQRLGVGGFLTKPLRMETVLGAIVEVFGHKHLLPGDGAPVESAGVKRLHGARVLLAEDNHVNRIVAREILMRFGAEVVTANNGLQAVEAVAGEHFDIVLMDIQMPVMDGYEASATIRRHKGELELPIIALTANAYDEERERCLAAGMNDHIAKPIDPDQLYSVVLRWINPGRQLRPVSCVKTTGDTGSADVFPDSLPGIDIASVMRRCDGNRRLVKDIIVSFRDQHRTAGTAICNAVRDGDNALALSLLHNLKGLSGTVGATALHSMATEMETALKGDGVKSCESMLSAMERQLVEFFDAADIMETILVSDEPVMSGMPVPADELAPLLKELHGALRDNDLSASSLFEKFEGHIASPERDEIRKYIARFDFVKAMRTLELTAQSIGIEL